MDETSQEEQEAIQEANDDAQREAKAEGMALYESEMALLPEKDKIDFQTWVDSQKTIDEY